MQRDFRKRIGELYGERGEAWLEELPERIAACERRWSLVVGQPFEGLSYNWVAPATARDGSSVVLKLGVPNPELTSEIEALRAWAGEGAARLMEADPDEGVLVLEHLRPGASLAKLDDDRATSIAVGVMRELHRVIAIPQLRTVEEWTQGVVRAKTAGFAPALIGRATALREELLASSPPPVLLHGDLHHFNILSAERQPWLAIDPKGVVGDAAYEPAPFLYNPIERVLGARAIVQRRIDMFAEHFDRQRVVGWAFVQAVLSAWWSFEDHGAGYEPALGFAELVDS